MTADRGAPHVDLELARITRGGYRRAEGTAMPIRRAVMLHDLVRHLYRISRRADRRQPVAAAAWAHFAGRRGGLD
jgi:hypothetical protein